jgi:alkaline phosphatase D
MTGDGTRRRDFIAGMGALGAAAAMGRRWLDLAAVAGADVAPVDPAFPLGIAAGDPREDGSVIWTAVPARPDGAPVRVGWEVARDASFRRVVQQGRERATADIGYTVHAVVRGLRPDGWYHYRFHTPGGTSRVGRLRTTPRPGRRHQRLRLAFSSCQQINDSPYVAHRAMAAEDLDFWVHYGDYIYVHDALTVTLDDYRTVYRRFKADPLLQHLHATYPVVAMWDDGEFVNGIDRTLEPARFAAAKQAWFEHQPVRRPRRDPDRTYREIEWGDLATFLLLDTRQYRDPAIPGVQAGGVLPFPTVDTRTPDGARLLDADRTCLGAAQKRWLTDRVTRSEHTWRHIGHGYNFLALRLEDLDTPEARADPPPGFHLNEGRYVAADAWDNYAAERREILGRLAEAQVPNVVVTAGHTHIWFAGGLRPDHDDLEGSPVVAHEFVCGSLTADPDVRRAYLPGLPLDQAEQVIRSVEELFLGINPHIDYIDSINQGYGLVELTPAAATVAFRVIDTFAADPQATTRASWELPAARDR